MPFNTFFIGPLNTGLQNDVRPWLIPDDAFSRLTNAFLYRGRVRKRPGSRLLNGSVAGDVAPLYSRLRLQVGTTDGMGDFGPAVMPGAIGKIGQLFSVGDTQFTVYQANGATYTTGMATATYNTATRTLTITGNGENPATPVYFYPAEPVMGFANFEQGSINDEPTFAFDTQFSYQFIGGAWEILGPLPPAAGSSVWTGTNGDFFWTTNWRGLDSFTTILFVSNYVINDGIRYWDGTLWDTLNPPFNAAGDTIETSRIILPFKDRLILLNVVEDIGGINRAFVNRCRFSQNGSPLGVDAWREDIAGRGGYIDAATREAIIGAEFIKDRLIVFFERSTWELVYTGNEILPFRWQQINTELGVESTFSVVPFDKVALGIANVGIHACNGANVERIDQKIPQEVFEIHNDNDGVFRVHGIRDYFNEVVYWTFPDQLNNSIYPTRILVFNYERGSWAFFDDSITTFGYFQNANDITWATSPEQWLQNTNTWSTGANQSKFRNIIAGNQEGYTFIFDSDHGRNAPSLQITDIQQVAGSVYDITAVDHNLANDEYVILENLQGITGFNNQIFQVSVQNTTTIRISAVDIDGNPLVIMGAYSGGGTLGRISLLNIYTKQYNFYAQEGRNAYISQVNCMVDKTSNGQLTVDYFPSSTEESMLNAGTASGSIMGTGVLETTSYGLVPLESIQTRIWHPVYLQTDGEVIQLRFYLSDVQMRTRTIAWSDFELHAMLFYAQPTSFRLQ